MKIARRFMLGAVAVFAVSAVSAIVPSAQAGGPTSGRSGETSGTLVITADTTLGEDHQGKIVIAADFVTLDCSFFTVSGDASLGAAIDLTGRRGVTVQNCTIRGFGSGVYLLDAHENNIDAVTVDGSAGPGCSLNDSNANLIIHSNFWNNGDPQLMTGGGCEFVNSHFNIFERNIVLSNGDEGLDLEDSHNNTFTANDVSSNRVDGFDLENSNANGLRENVVVDNTENGIELDGSNDNVITDNQTVSNGIGTRRNGISLDVSSHNAIRHNTSNSNGRNGIRINNRSNDNQIEANAACNNVEGDAFLANSTGNVFTGNAFCSGPPRPA